MRTDRENGAWDAPYIELFRASLSLEYCNFQRDLKFIGIPDKNPIATWNLIYQCDASSSVFLINIVTTYIVRVIQEYVQTTYFRLTPT